MRRGGEKSGPRVSSCWRHLAGCTGTWGRPEDRRSWTGSPWWALCPQWSRSSSSRRRRRVSGRQRRPGRCRREATNCSLASPTAQLRSRACSSRAGMVVPRMASRGIPRASIYIRGGKAWAGGRESTTASPGLPARNNLRRRSFGPLVYYQRDGQRLLATNRLHAEIFQGRSTWHPCDRRSFGAMGVRLLQPHRESVTAQNRKFCWI